MATEHFSLESSVWLVWQDEEVSCHLGEVEVEIPQNDVTLHSAIPHCPGLVVQGHPSPGRGRLRPGAVHVSHLVEKAKHCFFFLNQTGFGVTSSLVSCRSVWTRKSLRNICGLYNRGLPECWFGSSGPSDPAEYTWCSELTCWRLHSAPSPPSPAPLSSTPAYSSRPACPGKQQRVVPSPEHATAKRHSDDLYHGNVAQHLSFYVLCLRRGIPLKFFPSFIFCNTKHSAGSSLWNEKQFSKQWKNFSEKFEHVFCSMTTSMIFRRIVFERYTPSVSASCQSL